VGLRPFVSKAYILMRKLQRCLVNTPRLQFVSVVLGLPEPSLVRGKILLIVFVLSLAVSCISISTTAFTFAGSTSPDFRITASGPASFTSGSTSTSQVVVTPENEFYSEVVLTTIISPNVGLSVSVSPSNLVYGSGISTATFSSSTPGHYSVAITGASGSLSHTTSVAVTVTAVNTPDFTISASSSSINTQPFISEATIITITPNNGFTGNVTLSASVSPSGPIVTLSSSNIPGGTGTSSLRVYVGSNILAGTYTVTVQATSENLAHSKSIIVTVTDTQDIMVTANGSSLSFNSGASGTATITVSPQNGFIGTITLVVTAPSWCLMQPQLDQHPILG